jgi:hypothetical protein
MVALVALLLADVKSVQAGKVPSRRTEFLKNTGARTDITVPYLTTGFSTIIPGTYVQPRIYYAPMVDDLYLPDVRPVYNLPFWGGIQGFSALANGVMPTGLAVTPRELSPFVRPNAAMPVGTTITIK